VRCLQPWRASHASSARFFAAAGGSEDLQPYQIDGGRRAIFSPIDADDRPGHASRSQILKLVMTYIAVQATPPINVERRRLELRPISKLK